MEHTSDTNRFAEDIIRQLEADFGALAPQAVALLNRALEATEYLNNSRYIRCIIFLANKELGQLKTYIAAAIQDPWDVVYWAEYVNRESGKLKRVRDFNQSFEANDLSSREGLD